ncbi:MAG: succinate dehydrogenase / fumarate reductase, iron-sulfur subunit [Candidatus Micrarchaeota archaeon]|nr:MAG: succinate dehydrogenase / fumarate reductase, iron-sulfur subunit [Candidatus Micrarchaeota archaeon]
MTKKKFRIFRFDPNKDKEPYFKEYEVDVKEGMVVLDAVIYISQMIDTTLAVRWNCKAARCGSCSAEINGKPRLMCKTRVSDLGDTITIEPMKAFKIVKDLVTDVSINFEYAKKIPKFNPKPGLPQIWQMQQISVERAQEFKRCIECFLCQDSCHVFRNHKDNYYIGPRNVIKTAIYDFHPLDSEDRTEFLDRSGLNFCNVTKCCQEVCPEHIRITDNAIIPEKERLLNRKDPLYKLVSKLKGRDR